MYNVTYIKASLTVLKYTLQYAKMQKSAVITKDVYLFYLYETSEIGKNNKHTLKLHKIMCTAFR